VFIDAPFYVGHRDADIEPEDIESTQLIRGRFWRGRWSATESLGSSHTSCGWQLAEPLREYDVLVTSGNEPLFYVPPDDQVWVAYIHHTNRRQSDQIGEVASSRVRPIKLLLYYAMRVAYDHNTHKTGPVRRELGDREASCDQILGSPRREGYCRVSTGGDR